MSATQELYKIARKRMPGGVQLLSKRPEMFAPGQWPAYAVKAKGCELWDPDGKHYYDMTTNGIGACLLGYADPDVTQAVVSRVENGSMTSLNAPEEVWLADRLCQIHPWAESVRFARTGGETAAIAVRIARAATGRDIMLICGYHGWSDWYLAVNRGDAHGLDGVHLAGLAPAGVPQALAGTAYTFRYNDRAAFDQLISQYGDRIAGVIMEPIRSVLPRDCFLEHVRDEIHRIGGVLIFDEITIGWRYCFGGSHLKFGVQPDIALFAKALGNGHPIGAIMGTKAVMEAAQGSFISSTYWTEAVGPTAALATIDKIEKVRAWEFAAQAGDKLTAAWNRTAERNGVAIHTSGLSCMPHFDFAEAGLEQKTLYTVLMLKEGFLGNTACYPTMAHSDDILARYEEAMDKVFYQMGKLWKEGGVEAITEAIGGPVCQTGFQRLVD